MHPFSPFLRRSVAVELVYSAVRRLLPLLLALVLALPARAAPGSNLPARQAATTAALAWFRSQQRADGSGGDFGISCDLARVVALAGQNPAGTNWTPTGRSLLAACEDDVPVYLARRDAGRMAKVLRAVMAAGANPRQFGDLDLIAALEAKYDPSLGFYDPNFFFRHDLAVLALIEAGRPIPSAVLPALLGQQRPDGGWGWAVETTPEDGFSTPSDLDTTVRTLQALRDLGLPLHHPAFARGLRYLRSLQNDDAGWGLQNGPTNTNSTALAIEGILAAGWDPESSAFQHNNRTPLAVLLSLQDASGAFIYRPDAEESRFMATLDAVPALLHPYPGDAVMQFIVFLPILASN